MADVRSVGEALGALDVPVLMVKGLAHASWFYCDMGARQLKDIDILVPCERFLEADDALRSGGYCRLAPSEGSTGQFLNDHHFIYKRPTGGIQVEMHRRLFRNSYLWPESFEDVYARGRMLTVQQGIAIRTLSDTDALLNMFIHGSIHSWRRLFWLCDVAEAFATLDAGLWDSLMREAAARGYLRVVFQGASLAGQILGAPVPEAIRAAMPGPSPWLASAPRVIIGIPGRRIPVRARMLMTVNRMGLFEGVKYKVSSLWYIAFLNVRGAWRSLLKRVGRA